MSIGHRIAHLLLAAPTWRRPLRSALAATLLTLGGAAPLHAALLTGDVVTLVLTSSSFSDTFTAAVGAGVEWTFGSYSIDIGDGYLRITADATACILACDSSPLTLAAVDLDFSPPGAVQSVTLVNAGIAAFAPGFFGDVVSFSMNDVLHDAGAYAELRFSTDAAPVPAPATLALVLLAGLGLRRVRHA